METDKKEYKYLHTFADSSFESDVNGLVRQGWKVIHIEWLIPDVAVFLERDIPVEELKPYSVLETDTINGFDIMRDGLCVMTFPYGSKEAGYYRNELAAKEAAEAEADRLNAEWRKEHKND